MAAVARRGEVDRETRERATDDPDAATREAEQSVLGALLSGDFAGKPWLPQPADYQVAGHDLIAHAIAACVAEGDVDHIVVFEKLRARGQATAAGGLKYLNSLASSVPSRAAVEAHARIVRDGARRRQAEDVRARMLSLLQGTEPLEAIAPKVAACLDTLAEHAPTPRPRPRTIDLRTLANVAPPPRSWMIRDWLGTGPTLFAASGGTGKTLLAQQTATALSIGRSFIGDVERPLRSLLWACEDDADELGRRQHDISRHFEIDVAAPADNLILQSRLGVDSMLMVPHSGELRRTNVFEELRQQVNDLRVDAVWLDNVAHLFGGDEVNRGQVTAFISALAGLVTGRPFSIVLLAHVSRQAGSEFAGSAAWENAVRMRWYLGTKLPDQKADDGDAAGEDVRYLAKRKTNYAQRDYVRFSYRGGVLVPDQATAGDAVSSHLDEKRAEQILVAGFKSLQAMGIAPTDGNSSPDFLPQQLVAKGLASGYGKRELARALDRLMGRGDFVRGQVGTYANRNPKQGLILTEQGAA